MRSIAETVSALRREPLAGALLAAAGQVPCHWVGGVVRDRLLGRDSPDFDALVEREGEAIAARLARELPARLVRLGREDFAALRLVGQDFVLDLWDRRGAPLEAELGRRDFTVNALAVGLESATGEEAVIDPFGGVRDLADRRLRAVGDRAFAEDPLRVLRAARLAAELEGFHLDSRTRALAAGAAPLLDDVAVERAREELQRLFAAPGATSGLRTLAEVGVYPAWWTGGALGSPAPVPPPVPAACREALCRWLFTFRSLPDATAAGRRAALDRLLARRLIVARQERFLRRALEWDELPADEAGQRRFLHGFGDTWRAAVAAFGEDGAATTMARLAAAHPEVFAPPRLLGAVEVAGRGGLAGRALGAALRELRDLQVTGAIRTREQALAWLTSRAAGSAP